MNTTEEKKNAYLQKFDRENDLSELGWGESKMVLVLNLRQLFVETKIN